MIIKILGNGCYRHQMSNKEAEMIDYMEYNRRNQMNSWSQLNPGNGGREN